jgi:Protein of unknown function (DUF4240)
MTNEAFWSIIEDAVQYSGGRPELFLASTTSSLGALAPDEVIGFQRVQDYHLRRSYSWDLWGAAYILLGGCGDDMFDYFRAWLVSQGRAVFEAAIANA